MEGALRRSLGSHAQHTQSLVDHTWSIQQSTTTHTLNTSITFNNKIATTPTHIANCFTNFTNNFTNIYVPPRDTTSTHYKTADTDIQHCTQYITNIPHSVLTGDVNAHSTLWHSYTDDHRGQLIADVISNSDHITLNTILA